MGISPIRSRLRAVHSDSEIRGQEVRGQTEGSPIFRARGGDIGSFAFLGLDVMTQSYALSRHDVVFPQEHLNDWPVPAIADCCA